MIGPRRSRGLSLLELLVALVLISVLITVSFTLPRTQRASASGAAMVLGGVLKQARQSAMAQGVPVGVGFPRQGGARHGSAYYLLRGYSTPRLYESRDLTGEFSGVTVFSGAWSQTPAFAPGTTAHGDWDLSTWNAPYPEDALFVFLPDGAVISTQPQLNGDYPLVVCSGLNTGSTTVAGQPTPELLGAFSATTILVGPEQIQTVDGLPQGSGVALLTEPSLAPSGATARLLAPTANTAPSITLTQVLPQPVGGLPPGVDATCRIGSHINLRVEALDPDGDPLKIEWTATPGGDFSQTGEVLMDWKSGSFGSEVSWTVPPAAVDGELYTLSCRVHDGRGGEDTAQVGVGGVIMALGDGRIYFSSDRSGIEQVYVMNSDGTEVTQVTTLGGGEPKVSPDGSRVLFGSGRTAGRNEIWVMNADGSGEVQVSDSTAHPEYQFVRTAEWSPDGTRIAMIGSEGARVDEYVLLVDADGSNHEFLGHYVHSPPATDHSRIEWLWSGNLPYTRARTEHSILLGVNRGELMRYPLDPVTMSGISLGPSFGYTNVSPYASEVITTKGTMKICALTPTGPGAVIRNFGFWAYMPDWAGADRIVYSQGGEIWSIRRDGTGQLQLTNHPATDTWPSWAPAP